MSCPNTSAGVGSRIVTCNGDGNGKVESPETYRFWQHLADASLIEGGFSGTSAPVTDPSPGGNIPRLQMDNAGVMVGYLGTKKCPADCTLYFADTYGHAFIATGSANADLLTPLEAINVDKKFDDGIPTSGTILTYRNTFCTDPYKKPITIRRTQRSCAS